MLMPIVFNSDEIQNLFNITEEDVMNLIDFTVKEITQEFYEAWQNKALDTLGGTADQYVRGLILVDEGWAKGAIVQTDKFSNKIELGSSPWDMKPALLAGPNAKTGKDGSRFNTVPFRFATPNANGTSSAFSAKLPKPVYKAILKKPQNISMYGGGMRSQGIKDSEIPKSYSEPKKNKITYNEKSGYDYKSSIFQGATRIKDPVTNQNKIMSFRRVSENSDPNAFIHPGFQAYGIAEKALADFDIGQLMSDSIDVFISQMGE